jgi:endo-1,4-beta-mannosidase
MAAALRPGNAPGHDDAPSRGASRGPTTVRPLVMAAAGQPFLLGVNYWPRRKAMYWWEDFDAGEVRDEFALIASLGLTHVRVFLLWESFQPAPDQVSPRALRHLRTACDVAADAGLRVQVTFFTGHMSGPNWAPPWLLDRGRSPRAGDRQVVTLGEPAGAASPIHDIYAMPFVVEAEDLLLRAVCTQLADHPALWAWSLGNEPDLFCRPRDAAAGRTWVRDRVATIRALDPDRPVLVGLHSADIEGDVGFRVDDIAAETDMSVMHGYSIYSGLARGPLDPDFVPFTAALTAALAGRPILYEEFGVNTGSPDGPGHWKDLVLWGGRRGHAYFASEDDAAAYLGAVLPRLVRVGCLGAFAWCFADYEPRLWSRPPCDLQVHERFFGLVRPDGSLKPGAEAIRRFAASRPLVRDPERVVELVVSPDEYYRDPPRFMAELYERFGRLG